RCGGGRGGCDDTADDGERLLYRPADPADGPSPSGTFAAAGALLSYAALTGSFRHREAAVAALGVVGPIADRFPPAAGAGLAGAAGGVGRPAGGARGRPGGGPGAREAGPAGGRDGTAAGRAARGAGEGGAGVWGAGPGRPPGRAWPGPIGWGGFPGWGHPRRCWCPGTSPAVPRCLIPWNCGRLSDTPP